MDIRQNQTRQKQMLLICFWKCLYTIRRGIIPKAPSGTHESPEDVQFRININKSAGSDGIYSRVLKELAQRIG